MATVRSHRLITLREAVRRADPDWDYYNIYGVEYDFKNGRPNGRIFEAKTGDRGQYAPEEE